MATSEIRTPTWINYWGWGSGDMLGAGAQAVITGWLAYFFITFCGLTPLEAGLILGPTRLIEGITCPLIGYISDNLRHTWIGRKVGRRKVFLLLTIPLLPSFALIFVTGQTFLYYLLTFIFFEFVYTMFLIPWETLAAEMTKDYKEKAKFAGARMLVAQGSAILASYLPTLINIFGGKGSSNTFLIMAAIFGGIFSLVVLLVVLLTWERPYTEAEKRLQPEPMDWGKAAMVPINMFRDLFSTLRLRAFRQHLSLYLGGYISQDIFNTAFPLFVATVMMGSTLVISGAMSLMYVAQLVSVMIAIRVIIRTGPTYAYRIAISFVGAGLLLFLGFYLVQPTGFAGGLADLGDNIFSAAGSHFNPVVLFWLFLPIVLAGLGRGTLNFVPWGVYNYLPDVDEAVTGQRREGIFAGVMTFVRKFAQAGAVLATTAMIGAGGFVSPPKGAPMPQQSPEALRVLVLVMVGLPILVMLAGMIVTWSFRLNARTHAMLVHEVERLRAGATEAESPESKAVVEDLTGWKFEHLWGRG
ncbi:MAG TPA: MFS transporter [Caulobacter sp.]|nr:MFS transporter [Caulobacter sp.]